MDNDDNGEIPYKVKIIPFVRTTVASGVMVTIVALHLKLFWFKLEPVHIFLINYFGFSALYFLNLCSSRLVALFYTSTFCIQNYFKLFLHMANASSMILLQIDRSRAVYWNAYYNDKVDNKRALIEISACLSLVAAITICAGFIFPDLGECLEPANLWLTKPVNIFFTGFLRILSVITTIGVICYVMIVNRRLASTAPVNVVVQQEQDQERSFLEMLKEAKLTNLMTLPYLIFHCSLSILGMVYINCSHEEGECIRFHSIFEGFIYFSLVSFSFTHGLIIRGLIKKL